MGTCQSALSSISALLYLLFRRQPGQSASQLLGVHHDVARVSPAKPSATQNGGLKHTKTSKTTSHPDSRRYSTRALLLRYFQCAVFITSAAPFGFAALSYITYPAMVLGKSCKLVPVMIMNVLLYRRRFAPHKYLVVGMVTLGITMFMGFGKEKPSKAQSNGSDLSMYTQLIGITYLLINLAIDGATNSTQDEIFARFNVSGQQMMFWINLFCTVLTAVISVLPLPYIPVLHPSHSRTELEGALEFIRTHPSVVMPLVQFALTGALGQLFIFETLQHFGSLTLVYVLLFGYPISSDILTATVHRTITLTRKLFTMLLSVVVYHHKLTPGQWLGAAVVFAGISVEAWVKRRGQHRILTACNPK